MSTESIRNSCDNTDHNYSITVQEQAEVEILQENTDPLDAGHKDLVILSNSGQVLETNPSFVEVINEQTTILQGRAYQYAFFAFFQAVSVRVCAHTHTRAGAAHSVRSACVDLAPAVRAMCV